jgi:hypothetical protein
MLFREKGLPIVIIFLILISLIALPSCTPDSDLGEYKVPSTYTTYKDKNGLFSISYPQDWKIEESRLSSLSAESDSLNEYLKGNIYTIDTHFPNAPNIKDEWLPFIASEDNDDKNGIIVLSAISKEKIYLKGKTKEQIYNIAFETKDYKPFLQETLKIAGKEVAIFKYPANLETSQIISIMITDNIVWVLVCRSQKLDNQDDTKDYQIIVRSLRILK